MSTIKAYSLIEELGEGTFGKVFKARSKETGRYVAIKVYKDVPGIIQFNNETAILKQIAGETPYVVEYVEHFDDDIKHFLVLELAESSLFAEIRRPEHICGLPEYTLQQLILQLGYALEFLASKSLVHRDLKPGNVLLWKLNGGRYLFKLCDFGNSRVAAAEMDSIAGTVPYACPPVISNCVNPVKATYSACEADLWALATLIYHCATGRQAFEVPRGSLHRNADLFKLQSERPLGAIAGRIRNGKAKYSNDLPEPCRYPRLFKEALVRYLLKLLDCKATNFSFIDNKLWAVEFGRMKPSLIYHLHQSRVEKFFNTANTTHFAPGREIRASDIFSCDCKSIVFISRCGSLSVFDPAAPEWKEPGRHALAAVGLCMEGTNRVCPLANSGLYSGHNARADERLAAAVKINAQIRELSTLPDIVSVFHREVSDLVMSKNIDCQKLLSEALRLCAPCAPASPDGSLCFSENLADARLKSIREQLSKLNATSVNDMQVLETTHQDAAEAFETLDDFVVSTVGSSSSLCVLDALYKRLFSTHVDEDEKLDSSLLTQVRAQLFDVHKKLSTEIYKHCKEVFCGDGSLFNVIRRQKQMFQEYSSYVEMMSAVKGIDLCVQDQPTTFCDTKSRRQRSPIQRLNDISMKSVEILSMSEQLLKMSSTMSHSRPLCRYFANGCCRNGDRCSFSHDRGARQDLTCRFYSRGHCAYGDNCRYDHSRQARNNNANSSGRDSDAPRIAIAPGTANAATSSDSVTTLTNSFSKLSTRGSNRMPSAKDLTSSSVKMSANAPVFVPSWLKSGGIAGHGELEKLGTQDGADNNNLMSYASAAGATFTGDTEEEDLDMLCPYHVTGSCPFETCEFIHGLVCELCGTACLHPFYEEQRKKHHRECVEAHEKAMEDAFAEARTIEKQCGICMDNVWEKNGRFGILQNCRHCFCLECIRKWRQQQQFEHTTTRSCPECRTHSDFVIPATRWVEDQAEKERLIELYRQNTSKKVCKYFKPNDMDSCPFGNKCFYRHENEDGTPARCDSPSTISRRNRDRTPRIALGQYIDMFDDSEIWSVGEADLDEDALSEVDYILRHIQAQTLPDDELWN